MLGYEVLMNTAPISVVSNYKGFFLFFLYWVHVQWELAVALFHVIFIVGSRLLEWPVSRSLMVFMAKNWYSMAMKSLATSNHNSLAKIGHILYPITSAPVNSVLPYTQNWNGCRDRIIGKLNDQYPKTSNSRSHNKWI